MQLLPALAGGGVERGTLEVAKALIDAGHASHVVSAGGRLVPTLVAAGSTHHELPIGEKSLRVALTVPRLASLIEAVRPDILHLRSRLPAWVAHGALAFLQRRRKPIPKVITTVHGANSVSRYSRILTRGDAVICVSQFIHDYVCTHYPDVPPERLHVIPRGVDPALYHPGFQPTATWRASFDASFPATRDKRWLVLLGRLSPRKGQRAFIDVVAPLLEADATLHGLIVGGAEPRRETYRAELEALLEERGLGGRITLTGARDDAREILSQAAVAFTLADKPEAFGRSTLEALALGTPVVGFASGGTAEILTALYPEGLVSDGDIAAARASAVRVLNTRARPQSGAGPYTLARMLEDTLSIYGELVDHRDPN